MASVVEEIFWEMMQQLSQETSSTTEQESWWPAVPTEEIAPLAVDRIEVLLIEGSRIQCGLYFFDVIDGIRGVEELVEFSVSLNDWLRLDAGHFGDGDDIDEYKLRVVVAHHANSCLLNTRKLARDKSWENSLWTCGLFLNNLV
ncbi:hypothetical protein Ancab_023074, partial [Ancistrocladus abbreviatus]